MPRARLSDRRPWVLLHRWAGLYMAVFLAVAGATGSIIAFYGPLNAWLNPRTAHVEVATALLDPLTLMAQARAQAPDTVLFSDVMPLGVEPGVPVSFIVDPAMDPASGQPYSNVPRELFLDPHTGQVVHIRYGVPALWPITRANVLDVIYRLHYSLALPGEIGTWLFGIAAIVWTLDCFIGAYLTFPIRMRAKGPQAPSRTWLSRWKPAWRVRWAAGSYKLNFDLHRAGGLWVWLMLLILAWSSVGLNLGRQVYEPVMGVFFDMKRPEQSFVPLPRPLTAPSLGWPEALAQARTLAGQQAAEKKFSVLRELELGLDREHGLYAYRFHSDADIGAGSSALYFDANSGVLRALALQDRQPWGPWLTDWLFTLHFGAVGGLPMKIFICAMGLVVTTLCVTGVYVWWRKRQSRRATSASAQAFAPAHQHPRTRRFRVRRPEGVKKTRGGPSSS